MKPFATTLCAAALCLGADLASAAAPRTFVSGKGADSGTCAVTSPCRSFAYAITQTAPGGEILVLDSAGYGPVTITQAVSIAAPTGIEGAITVPSGANGITVSAGTSDKIVIRGLTIDGAGLGANGIVFNSGGSLTIIGCLVQNLTGNDNKHGNGILIQHASGAPTIAVDDTKVINNTYIGVSFIPTGSGGGRIDVDHLIASNNLIGFAIYGAATGMALAGTLTNSVTNTNATYGVQLIGVTTNGYGIRTVLSHDESHGNANKDLYAAGFAVVNLSDFTSDTFQRDNGSLIYTFGNNAIVNPTATGGNLSTETLF